MLIDSHAHLGYDALYENIEEVLKRANQVGVEKIVNICTDQKTAERGLALAKQTGMVFNVGATTPHDLEKLGAQDFIFFKNLARNKQLVAIGETGLDYFHEHSPKELQKKFFSLYLALAIECSLPVVIHCRDAFEDLFAMTAQEYRDKPLLLHCFTGGKEEAKIALDRGWKISFSGILTFKKSEALREAALYTPLDSILIETDSPYLAPESKRGKTNEPSFIVETAKKLAEIKKISYQTISEKTASNTSSFFNI